MIRKRFKENKSNNYTYYVTYADVSLTKDNYKHGAEINVENYWDLDIRGEYNSLKDIIKEVSRYEYTGEEKWWRIFNDGDSTRLETTCTSTEDGQEPTEEELEDFKKGEIDLYLKDIFVGVYKIQKSEVTEEDCEREGIEYTE